MREIWYWRITGVGMVIVTLLLTRDEMLGWAVGLCVGFWFCSKPKVKELN